MRLKNPLLVIKLLSMITTEHNVCSVGGVLTNFKTLAYNTLNSRWLVFDAVVIDNSWPMIHAFLEALWNLDMNTYLNIVYEHCEQLKKFPKSFMLLKLCYGHHYAPRI